MALMWRHMAAMQAHVAALAGGGAWAQWLTGARGEESEGNTRVGADFTGDGREWVGDERKVAVAGVLWCSSGGILERERRVEGEVVRREGRLRRVFIGVGEGGAGVDFSPEISAIAAEMENVDRDSVRDLGRSQMQLAGEERKEARPRVREEEEGGSGREKGPTCQAHGTVREREAADGWSRREKERGEAPAAEMETGGGEEDQAPERERGGGWVRQEERRRGQDLSRPRVNRRDGKAG